MYQATASARPIAARMNGFSPAQNRNRHNPMRPMDPIALAKNYVALSNAHDLMRIKQLFSVDAIYHSAFFGEYRGFDAIHTMMVEFFTHFPDAHWEVPKYRSIGNDGAEFAFIMTGTNASTGEHVERHGLERIIFTPEGLIRHIAVCKPERQ